MIENEYVYALGVTNFAHGMIRDCVTNVNGKRKLIGLRKREC
jgi:hypothetical protein